MNDKTFSFTPKVLIISLCGNYIQGSGSLAYVIFYLLSNDYKYNGTYIGDYAYPLGGNRNYLIKVKRQGNSAFWYGYSAESQFNNNYSNYDYYYGYVSMG